jgi:ankyrin repeat protein
MKVKNMEDFIDYQGLITAIQNKSISGVKKYIDIVDSEYLDELDEFYYSPLMIAALNSKPEIIKIVLKKTPNPLLMNRFDNDAYYYATPNDKHIFTDMIPDFLNKRAMYKDMHKYNL